MPVTDFLRALRALTEGGVQFIVVVGLAAVLHGPPVNTFDRDIVHSTSPANVEKLLRVLEAIADCRPLDVLGTIGKGLRYEDLLPMSSEMLIGSGVAVQVLDLATIVALKQERAGEKDIAVLPVLRRTLQQKKNQTAE